MLHRVIWIFVFSVFVLEAGLPMTAPYVGPTESLIQRKSWKKIEKALKDLKAPAEQIAFFQEIAKQEDWGHLGYHGTNHSYRIYQDIIRMVVEEVMGLDVRSDFHFLRVPGDQDLNLFSVDEWTAFWGKGHLNNRHPMRSKQLLSMNFSLYAHYTSTHNSSIYYFVNNRSSNDIEYTHFLEPFFEILGIDPSTVKALFAIGEKWLNDEQGTLLQISENSHLSDPRQEAYNFADQQAYPSKKRGYRYGSLPISSHYQRVMTKDYVRKKIDVAPQLRLLLNNRYSLNPYSDLVVRRWELASPLKIALYEAELRSAIQTLSSDPEKVASYREKLLKEWL